MMIASRATVHVRRARQAVLPIPMRLAPVERHRANMGRLSALDECHLSLSNGFELIFNIIHFLMKNVS